MHLANGTLANDVCTATAALSAVAVAWAARRAVSSTTPGRLVRAVAGSALVLGAQMIDVTLFNSTTVHVVGAAFLTLLAGPALAVLGMTAVVVTQALLLNDGGVTVLGANVLNMAVTAVGVSWLCIRAGSRRRETLSGMLAVSALAAGASVAAAIVVMCAELAFSGVSSGSVLSVALPAHAPFIVWEAAATFLLVVLAAHARALDPLVSRT